MLLQFLRLSLISGLVFIVLLAAGLAVMGWIYRDNVSHRFIDAINRQLSAELKTEEVQLNLFRSFPLASVSFKNTTISNPGETEKEPLLIAGDIRLEFNIADILRGDYSVRRVNISEARLSLRTDSLGRHNYIIWKSSADTATQGFRFDIRSMQLNNVNLDYRHIPGDHHISTGMERLRLSGRFDSGNAWIYAKGGMLLHEVNVSGNRFPPGQTLAVDTKMDILRSGEINLQAGEYNWNGQEFVISGQLNTAIDGLPFSAHITGAGSDIKRLIDGIPANAATKLMAYSPGGTISFEASVGGEMASGDMPVISSSFIIENASFRHPDLSHPFSVITARGDFSNGQGASLSEISLSVDNIVAGFDGGTVKGRGSIRNFDTPGLAFSLRGSIPAEELVRHNLLEQLSHAGGEIDLEIDFSGRMSRGWQFTGNDLLSSQISGNIIFRETSFSIKGKPLLYQNLNSEMTFRGNRLEVGNMSVKAGESDFSLKGYMTNVLPYLFLSDETLFIHADLYSENINLDELLKTEEVSPQADTAYNLTLPGRLRLNVNADIQALKFRLFRASGLSGHARMENRRLYADNLVFNTMGGNVNMYGILDGNTPGNVNISCQAALSGVDINQLFYQTGNFGQQNITDDNIHGKLSATMFFRADWSPSLEIDWESMETTADLRIIDGRLVNYRPMMEMGRFLRTGDLSDVSFSALENEIHIRDRNIIIPQMDVSSSAINLELSGVHSFEGEIDYRIQVLLSDLLARNHRERRNPQENYGDIIDDGLGRTTLFLRLSGTSRNPVFRYDYQGVRQKISEDLREERRNLMNILREEFSFLGRQRSDSVQSGTDESERLRNDLKKQEEGEFLIEWEEDW